MACQSTASVGPISARCAGSATVPELLESLSALVWLVVILIVAAVIYAIDVIDDPSDPSNFRRRFGRAIIRRIEGKRDE